MLVADTSVWVDYFNGVENPQTDFLHRILDSTRILFGVEPKEVRGEDFPVETLRK